MDRIRRAFSSEEDEQGILSSVDTFSLSWSSRIKGFAICFAIGICLSILASIFLWLPHKGTILFAFLYTVGNLFSLGSTFFLMGPLNQLKRMFKETRIFAAVIMLACMAITIFAAVEGKKFLCLVSCVLQSLALTWYSLSYIPFARDAVKACCTAAIV